MDHSEDDSAITDIFLHLENEFCMVLPIYIKKLLIFNGFDNVYSLTEFKEDDIQDLEHFAEKELFEVAEEEEINAIYKSVYYKMFERYKEQKRFRILKGHKRLLILFISKCVENKGNLDKALNKKKRCSCKCTCQNLNKKPSKKQKHNKENLSENANENASEDEDKNQRAIEDHITVTARSYVKKMVENEKNEDKKKEILENIKTLNVHYENKGLAKLTCPIAKCNTICNITATATKTGIKWILSNFNKHFSRIHMNKLENKSNIERDKLKNTSILQYLNITNNDRSTESGIESTPVIVSTSESESSLIDCTSDYANGNVMNQCLSLASNAVSDVLPPESSLNINYPDYHITNLDDPFFVNGRGAAETCTSDRNKMSPNKHISKWKEEKYSRHQRQLRKRDTSFNLSQKKIPEFFNIIESIDNIIKSHPEIAKDILNTQNFNTHSQVLTNKNITIGSNQITGLLKVLVETAERNCQVNSTHGNRFSEQLKMFSLYTFLIGGKLLYEILYANMNSTLPSLSTLYRKLDQYCDIDEGEVQFNELRQFLDKRNLPLKIFVSEDQTAIVKRVQYNPRNNKMVGFFVPVSPKTGFPLNKSSTFTINSVNDIETAFNHETLCGNAYAIVAQPLHNAAPSFCLSIFGSNNKFNSEDVLKRWEYIEIEAKKCGITIEGFSSDGDTRCLKSMKIRSQLPSSDECIYSPYFQMDYNLNRPVFIQDTVHICTKLKTRLTKPGIFLPMGRSNVSVAHIEELIHNISKDKHLLCLSDLNNTDKMNFKAIDKLSSQHVIDLLQQIQNSESTRQFLRVTLYIKDSFLNKSLDLKDRVYYIWYAIFFIRLWRQWIIEKKYSIQNNFLTLNTYTCIELNGHGLLLMIDKCRKNNTPNLFLPWLFSSQPCEKTFRQARSMTTTYSTIINFSLYEFIKKLNRIRALNEISTDLGDQIKFPRDDNRLGSSQYILPDSIPSSVEILEVLSKAKSDAIQDATCLDLIVDEMKKAIERITIPVVNVDRDINPIDSEDNEEDDIVNNDNIYISDDEVSEIKYDISLFSTFTNFHLKDYSAEDLKREKNDRQNSTTSPYLKVVLNNNKVVTVRKSSLCWFFSEKAGRLSADRLLRVRGMSIDNKKRKKTQKTVIKRKYSTQKCLQENQEETTDTSESEKYSSKSETEDFYKSDDEEMSVNQEYKISSKISIILERYYAVFYDNMWYLGRILRLEDDGQCVVKFLEQFMDNYQWPKKDDIQKVSPEFVFHGPINLLGSHPFKLKRTDFVRIKQLYKQLKC